MEQKDVNALMEKSPEWRQKDNCCENCERLEKRIKVLEDTLSGVIHREYLSPIDREIHKNAAMHLIRKTLEVKP